ncbi:MAG TPA: FlgD immunoglobulin-like domain containing protein, partial [Candidatus Krumholzibacteria bacterium]|nr:FlgD immunoglobulin-like domain containing protein [Candidatus Krumholzibacteria bacterium]
RSGPVNADIYAQRINSAGVIQWTYDGIPIHTGAQDYGEARKAMISDGAGGAFIVWEDWRSNNFYDIYAQRVNSAGLVLWLPNGVAVSTAANNQLSPVIASDASNGTVISWQDLRTGSGDIYAQRLNYAGFPQWAANGVPVCTATGNQRSPAMLEEGSGGAVIAWEDTRSGAYDIYAQRLIATGESCAFVVTRTTDDDTPGSLRTAIRQANVVPGPQSVSFNIPGPGPHTITLTSQLPAITDGLVIDGFTQPGASSNTNAVGSPCNAHIMIDIHGGFTGDGFKFQAPGTLRGVATHSFYGRDVLVQADPVVIEGNYIGLDAGGYGGWLNQTGIWIQANHCRVGGATAAARNVITEGSYQTTGIQIEGAWYAQIYGNYIGTMTDLTDGGLGNATGVLIQSGGRSNTLGLNEGTLNHEEANVIAYNGTAVSIKGAGTIDNGVFGNSFRGNTTFGIDLAGDGRTPNDVGDGDDGPNHLQNYPVLSGATGTQVTGDMHGKPGDSVILNFYRSTGCSPGNGEVYLGNQSVNMNGSGDASYTFAPAQPVPPESWITVTARDFFGNTSEMSDCVFSKNTPGGNNVVVNLVDGNNAVRGTATFATVNNNGNTFVTTPYTPPVLISGYAIGNPNDPQIYFNITTNASYTGGVDVCLNYDENNIPGPEANLVLLHYNGTMWANVTTSRDPVNNKICGHVTSLSPFVIGAVTTTGVQDKPTPNRLALHANVPNPFNPITTISYDVPAHGADVNISIYDVSGRLVRDLVHEHRTAGVWSVEWNGEDDRGQRVASGVYFYRMRAGAFVDTKKMVLLK